MVNLSGEKEAPFGLVTRETIGETPFGDYCLVLLRGRRCRGCHFDLAGRR